MPGKRDQSISPVCSVECVHADVVNAVKGPLTGVEGAGELLSALADDTRLKVLYSLSQAEMCVCDVAVALGVSKAVASYHLRLLYRMGLATYRKQGRLVYYSLAAHDVVPVVEAALNYALSRTTQQNGSAANG
jgi:DNA-binding transcriptional ArsR family regulator